MEVRTTQHQVSLGTAWNILQRNIMLMETVWTGGFYSIASSVSAHGMDDFSAWHHMWKDTVWKILQRNTGREWRWNGRFYGIASIVFEHVVEHSTAEHVASRGTVWNSSCPTAPSFRTFVGARRHANFLIHIFSHALSSDTFPNFLESHPTWDILACR